MDQVKITKLCNIEIGKTPSRSNATYWGSGTSWVSIRDMKGKYILNTKEEITPKAISETGIKLVPKNTVIMSFKLTVGKVAILSKDMYTNEAIAAFHILDDNELNNKYLYYALQTLRFSENTDRAVMGLTLNKQKLKKLRIPLPPLNTQKKIVEVLDKAQALIDARKEQIRLMDDLIQSVFYEMFGDPVTNPKGWEVKNLKRLTTKILSGNTPKGGRQVYVEEGVAFFRSQNVWRNRLELDDIAFIDMKTHEKMKKSSLKNKDILMTKTGRINTENSSLGRAAMFIGEDDSANINGHVYLVRLRKEVIQEFVLFVLTTDEYREYIRRVCVGGIDKRQINKNHLEEFPIIMPPLKEQKVFVEHLNNTISIKANMNLSLKRLEDNFNSLIQTSFNGD